MSMSMSMMMGGNLGITGSLYTNLGNSGVSEVAQDGTSALFSSSLGNGYGIIWTGTNIWATDYNLGRIIKFDSNGSQTIYSLAGIITGMAFDGTDIWTCSLGGNISKVTSAGTITTYTGFGSLNAIAFDGTDMWSVGPGTLVKITLSGTSTIFAAPWDEPDIAFDGTNMWVTGLNTLAYFKADLLGNITTYSGKSYLTGICYDGTYMWIKRYFGGFDRVDSAGNNVYYPSPLNSIQLNKICYDGTYVWAVNGTQAERINVLTGNTDSYTIANTGLFSIVFDGCLLTHWWGGS